MSGQTWRWIGLLVFLASSVLALRLIGPSVPNKIIMLTGPDGTTFRDDGLRYQEILGSHGITVNLEQLANVDRSTTSIKVPLRSLENPWLELRQYLHDMRDRLETT